MMAKTRADVIAKYDRKVARGVYRSDPVAYCQNLVPYGVNLQACQAGVGASYADETGPGSGADATWRASTTGKGAKMFDNWLAKMNQGAAGLALR